MIDKPILGEDVYLDPLFADGLVGCWLMNEGSGNKVFDLSGNGIEGTVSVFTWGAGKYGSCLQHTGANDQIITLPVAYRPLDALSAFSVRVLSTPNTVSTDFCLFTAGRFGSDRPLVIWFDNGTPDRIAVIVNCSGGGTGVDYGTETIVGNKTYDVVVTYKDGQGVKLFVNGIEDTGFDGSGASGTLNTNGGDLYSFGNAPTDLHKDFEGSIHGAWLYKRALSASEIVLLYREPFWGFKQRDSGIYTKV